MGNPSIYLHKGDLPENIKFGKSVAIDTETMGLNPHRDRLCVLQISSGDGEAHLVQFNKKEGYGCPNLSAILRDKSVEKIFHYARFDIAVIYQYLGILLENVYCTKIASKLTRNFTQRHGLKNLCSELLGIEISKHSQSSDWGSDDLTKEQLAYAASDVLHLHSLKCKLDKLLLREGCDSTAQQCFNFLPTVAKLDLLGYQDLNIFSHS